MKELNIIPQNTFEELQMDAGILVDQTGFDPTNPSVPTEDHIISATTGGFQISITPTYTDFGADIDNCPNNTKELKFLESIEYKVSTTALGTSLEQIALAIGVADVANNAVTVRNYVNRTDFKKLYWLGQKSGGGFLVAEINNALSTGGFSLKTTKNGKGTFAIDLTAHISIENPSVQPVKFYAFTSEQFTSTNKDTTGA